LDGRGIPVFWVLFGLFTIFFTGIGLLIWIAPVPAEQLTPAQENLIAISDGLVKASDGLVKASAGAFVGFAGGVGLAARNGRRRLTRSP